MARSARLLDLGLRPYREVWDLQRELHARVADGSAPDTWLVVEHTPVVTLGRNTKREHLLLSPEALRARGVDCVEVERGGDVTGAPLLAHKAMREGVVAAEVIGGDRSAAYDPVAVPNCVYTDPEVATVGLSEEEAKAAGYDVRVGKFPLVASGRARTMNESDGLIKLVGDRKSDLLLGMHIVAPQAESLIGEGVIALEMGATLEDIGLSIHPHPTLTESIMDAAEAAHGKAIHLVNPKPKPAAAGVAG